MADEEKAKPKIDPDDPIIAPILAAIKQHEKAGLSHGDAINAVRKATANWPAELEDMAKEGDKALEEANKKKEEEAAAAAKTSATAPPPEPPKTTNPTARK